MKILSIIEFQKSLALEIVFSCISQAGSKHIPFVLAKNQNLTCETFGDSQDSGWIAKYKFDIRFN